MFYVLQMASPPKLGKCQVIPSEGISMEDLFSVKCSAFSSAVTVLIYSFYLDPEQYATNTHGELINISEFFYILIELISHCSFLLSRHVKCLMLISSHYSAPYICITLHTVRT